MSRMQPTEGVFDFPKKCTACGEMKPPSEYRTYGTRAGRRLKPECNACLKKRETEWRKTNPEKARRIWWVCSLRKYGLTIQAYEVLLQSQGGRCAICQDVLGDRGKLKKGSPHIDHDHATNRVRSILCGQCNVAIGALKDDPAIVLKAYEYLKKQKAF